jgi:hypothetical protein
VLGLEYSRVAIEVCRQHGLDVRVRDIEAAEDITSLGRFDVAICIDVAEHVKPPFADGLVRQLVSLSDRRTASSSRPPFPDKEAGVDHGNEQPHAYWIGKFASHGYAFLEANTLQHREYLARAGAASFCADNLMLFASEHAALA